MSRAPAFRRTDVAAPGGAPNAMSRSTARRKSTRSASRAFGASARTAAAALSAGTPLATRSASTESAMVSGGRRPSRRWVRTSGGAPARSAATAASSSGAEALVPSAGRAVPRSAAGPLTAPTIPRVGAPFDAVHEKRVAIAPGRESQRRCPNPVRGLHGRAGGVPIVEVSDQRHGSSLRSDQYELERSGPTRGDLSPGSCNENCSQHGGGRGGRGRRRPAGPDAPPWGRSLGDLPHHTRVQPHVNRHGAAQGLNYAFDGFIFWFKHAPPL